MGKPIERNFGQEKTIFKFFPGNGGVACVVPKTMATADDNGRYVVPAGTPFPSNDAKCLGYLDHSVDVTQGDAAGTYYNDCVIDPDKLKENGIVVTAEAKKATPKVTFYGEAYASATE